MAPNSIVLKIQRLVAEPIDCEAKVVYLLAELRKLLEPTPARERPFALNMHCHWALHVDLHSPDTIVPFLKRVDSYFDRYLSGDEDVAESHNLIREFIFFDTLRTQLRQFFQDHGIETALTDDDDRWNELLKYYAGVIEDGSLVIRGESADLKRVQQITFTKGRTVGDFLVHPFKMIWTVTLRDGRTIDVDVSARTARDGSPEMIAWGLHLRG